MKKLIILMFIFLLCSCSFNKTENHSDDYLQKCEELGIQEITVVQKDKIESVSFDDDTFWKKYIKGDIILFSSVFQKDRKLKLYPYVMSKNVVSYELYSLIMENKSASSGVKEFPRTMSWYDAIVFCNELTKIVFSEKHCVYYSDKKLKTVYTKDDAKDKKEVFIAYDMSKKMFTKKGYRLPTELEWEFAARGGNPESPEWNYTYSGTNCGGEIYNPSNKSNNHLEPIFRKGNEYWVEGLLYIDPRIKEYSNCAYEILDDYIMQKIGKKKSNSLGINDMSGTIYEWTWDGAEKDGMYPVDAADILYKTEGWIQNPLGPEIQEAHIIKGGSYNSGAYECCVFFRKYEESQTSGIAGIRLCRSIQGEKIKESEYKHNKE